MFRIVPSSTDYPLVDILIDIWEQQEDIPDDCYAKLKYDIEIGMYRILKRLNNNQHIPTLSRYTELAKQHYKANFDFTQC